MVEQFRWKVGRLESQTCRSKSLQYRLGRVFRDVFEHPPVLPGLLKLDRCDINFAVKSYIISSHLNSHATHRLRWTQAATLLSLVVRVEKLAWFKRDRSIHIDELISVDGCLTKRAVYQRRPARQVRDE
jgi:hypothetical protein